MHASPLSFGMMIITSLSSQRAGGLGTVITDGKNLRKGDTVTGQFGWAEYVAIKESSVRKVTYVPRRTT
jgi:NADPH-dependent curcumin reductase CurA